MKDIKPLNIFYEEPDPDRWFKFDRYPRKVIRRILRGRQRPGGQMMIALNLIKGLNKMGIAYRFNDYRHIKKHPDEIACIIGKPQVLFERNWNNPIILGSGIYAHPLECPNLFEHYSNIKRVLVPGEWMRKMFEPYYTDKVLAWPTGIDTDEWTPLTGNKTFDFLIYDKIYWEYDKFKAELINPIIKLLEEKKLTYQYIKYGQYTHAELKAKLSTSKAALFLCRHETQGFAYQQILSANTPILAWNPGGYWQDPYYYPDKVKYQPVSSVPYWDDRCGITFTGINDFNERLNTFLKDLNKFKPRDYILENLTLKICAEKYMQIYHEVEKELI